MKKILLIGAAVIGIIITVFLIDSCSSSAMISSKSGAQLWGENCQRCHNTPAPGVFNDRQWETVGTHMQIRAGLTQDEAKKVINFLKSSN